VLFLRCHLPNNQIVKHQFFGVNVAAKPNYVTRKQPEAQSDLSYRTISDGSRRLAGSGSFRQLLLAIFSYKLNRPNHPSRRSTVRRSLLGRGKSSDSFAAVNSYFAFFQNVFISLVICRVLFCDIFWTHGQFGHPRLMIGSLKLDFEHRRLS